MPDGTPRPLTDSTLAVVRERCLRRDDDGFPAALLDLARPPLELRVRGEIPARERSIAIVGSRAASPYGIAQARRLAGDLAALGFAVVSGLARGIDAAAHRGALDAGGRTVAVLPGPLDPVTPAHHAELAREIAGRGALVTEHRVGDALSRGMFVERNRLIAALAAATVVVEAAERSGALSTAAAARRIGRPVLAVPGDVDRGTARGCHALIRDGARLCEGAADVLAVVAPAVRSAPHGTNARGAARFASRAAADAGADADPSTPEQRLHAALSAAPTPLEELAARAGVSAPDAAAALLRLEWAGIARAVAGQRWVRAAGAA